MRVAFRMALALAIIASMVSFSFSASAGSVTRNKGESWIYETAATENLMGFTVNLSGTVTYGFVGSATESIGGTDYSAKVLEVDGTLQGSVIILGSELGSASVTLSGQQSELSGTVGVLREEILSMADVTFGSGLISFTYHIQTQTNITTVPPLLADFDPATTNLGDSWTQQSTVNTTFSVWENGTLSNTTTESRQVTYTASVYSSLDILELPSGVFHATKIQVSDDQGNYDIFWWSSDVNNIVQREVHVNGSADPVMTMTLTDFNPGSTSSSTVYVIAGGAILLIAVVVLVIVLIRSRRTRPPVHTDQDPGHISSPDESPKV